tara:strand:- start:2145 stop:2309 length:165 start_codon:yes stop_codon:yes gene_type:complete
VGRTGDDKRIIQEPGFDIGGYIISKNITNQQEEEITARLGSEWKRRLWVAIIAM